MKFNPITNFLKSKSSYLFSFLILIFFYFSVNFYSYDFLRDKMNFSHIDSYLVDQFFFFVIFLIIGYYSLLKKYIHLNKNTFILFGVIFTLYFGFMLIFQSEILDRYFAKDDYLQLFGYLNAENGIDQSYHARGGFYYYQFSFFTLLFKFFKYNAFAYNLFGVFFMAFSGTILFFLLRFIANIHKIKAGTLMNLTIFVLGCIYLSSPTIMDMYIFVENTVAFGFIHGFLLLTLLIYINYMNDTDRNILFVLSFVLIIYLLKAAYVRTGFLPIILIFLESLFFKFNKKYFVDLLIRISLLSLAFLVRSQVYFIPNSPGRFYSFSIYDFIHFDKIYITFSGLITTFLPYQIWTPIIKYIRRIFLGDINTLSSSFFLNNILFIFGIIFCVATSLVIILCNKRGVPSRIMVFTFISALFAMAFFMFFGNTGIAIRSGSYDIPYIVYGDTPGSRYYVAPFLFFIILFFLLFNLIANNLHRIVRLFALPIFLFILIWLLISNVQFTQKINGDVNRGSMIPVRIYTEKVLNIVPDNNDRKVIYSTRIVLPIRAWTYDGFATLYTKSIPKYTDVEEEVTLYLQHNKIAKEDFYAFYFSDETLEFKDESELYREKYSDLFESTH